MILLKEGLKTEIIYGKEFYIYEGDLICKEDFECDFNLKITGKMEVKGKHIQVNSSIIVAGSQKIGGWQEIAGWQEIGDSQEIGGSQKIAGWQKIGGWQEIAGWQEIGDSQEIGGSQKIGDWQEIGDSQKIGDWQKIGGSQKIGDWQKIKQNTIASFVFLGSAFKLVDKDYMSPIRANKIKYNIGDELEITDFNSDINEDCGAGINLANWQWILKNKKADCRVLICQYEVNPDNICIPKNTDGKFRVKKCKVVAELPDNQIPWRIK